MKHRTSHRRHTSRRLVSLFPNKKRKTSKRRSSRKTSRRPSRASVRRTSLRLGRLFGMPTRFARKLSKPRRKTSKRRSLKARKTSKVRGYWRIVVRGRMVPKRFRSSSSLRAYANKKYGRGYKYSWQAR